MMQREAVRSRHVPLPGTFNLRDVGGYPTHEGLDTRWGALFRSDSLHNLDADGCDVLVALGVRTVIDLRRDAETSRAPSPCAADPRFAYANIPLAMDGIAPESHPRELTELYLGYLDHGQASIRAVVAAIAEAPAGGAVLVHCTAGKDRTGLVVALALGSVGVVPEAIMDDYLLTGELIEPLRGIIRAAAARDGQDLAALEPLLRCDRPCIQTVLSRLESRHGSAAGYLRAAGVTDAEMARLRIRLLGV